MSTVRAMTVEEFERIAPLLDGPSELVDGRLRLMSPTSFGHGLMASWIAYTLESYLDTHPGLGVVVGAETGFRIDNPHYPVQAPDAAFVRAGRMPQPEEDEGEQLEHFMVGAPDLAVEVRSPTDRPAALRAKAQRWLAAGTEVVWIVDPRRNAVQVLRQGSAPATLKGQDLLTAPGVLPEFSIAVADLLARRRHPDLK